MNNDAYTMRTPLISTALPESVPLLPENVSEYLRNIFESGAVVSPPPSESIEVSEEESEVIQETVETTASVEVNTDEILQDLGLDTPSEEPADDSEEDSRPYLASINEAFFGIDRQVDQLWPDESDDGETEEEAEEEQQNSNPEDSPEFTVTPNSESILLKETTSRFSSALWYGKIQEQRILLAGLGGIGSYVAFLLARMNPFQLTMYDDDIVEEVNLSGQWYGMGDVQEQKAASLARHLMQFANYYHVSALSEKYTSTSPTYDVMICGFDNMEARKTFFQNWSRYIKCAQNKSKCLFIDGRLAAEEFQVFTIAGDDERAIKEYADNHLFTDEEAEETVCSYKQTTFMANMIGSVMVNAFVNFIANQCDPVIPRDVPFYTTYNAETMYFKTIA
jgi:molybdopterin/thiamine biosynthesis adenylyltransferase